MCVYMAVRTENKPEMQGQLFLVQLKPISIIMCVQSTMRGLDEDMPGQTAGRILHSEEPEPTYTENK